MNEFISKEEDAGLAAPFGAIEIVVAFSSTALEAAMASLHSKESHLVRIGFEEIIVDLPVGACNVADFLKVDIRAKLEEAEFEFHVHGRVTEIEVDGFASGHCYIKLSIESQEASPWKEFVVRVEQRQSRLVNVFRRLGEGQ